VVGKVGGAEAGEEAEGHVEGADEESGGETHWAGGYSEVGDEPGGFRDERGSDAVDEGVEIGLGEAVEEEVGDDEIVRAFEGCGEDVGVVGAEADVYVWSGGFAALPEEFEHGGAGVYGISVDVLVVCKELGEETTVSIAYDQCAAVVEELWEVVEAAVLEGFAEGKVFEPAIGTSYRVEVGLGGAHW
jgi:hypothetical protein